MVTSRERPQNLATKFGQQLPMRCLTVTGLSYQEGQALLSSIGQFRGTSPEWQSMIDRYAGNPLAKIVASFVSEFFAGDLSQLLAFLCDFSRQSVTGERRHGWRGETVGGADGAVLVDVDGSYKNHLVRGFL